MIDEQVKIELRNSMPSYDTMCEVLEKKIRLSRSKTKKYLQQIQEVLDLSALLMEDNSEDVQEQIYGLLG